MTVSARPTAAQDELRGLVMTVDRQKQAAQEVEAKRKEKEETVAAATKIQAKFRLRAVELATCSQRIVHRPVLPKAAASQN